MSIVICPEFQLSMTMTLKIFAWAPREVVSSRAVQSHPLRSKQKE